MWICTVHLRWQRLLARHHGWTNELISSTSLPASHVNPPPFTPARPVMINDLEPLTSPLLPFSATVSSTLFPSEAWGDEWGGGMWWALGWTTGGVQPRLRGQASHKSSWRVHPGLSASAWVLHPEPSLVALHQPAPTHSPNPLPLMPKLGSRGEFGMGHCVGFQASRAQ